VRCLRLVQRRLNSGEYEPGIVRDLQAAVGSLAELAGWLLHDAGQQEPARAMNHEALFLTRLAGDQSMERLTLANMCFHDLFSGRPGSALQVASAVLDKGGLSNRIEVIFGIRRARALAQLGDRSAAFLTLDRVRAQFYDGPDARDPSWAWWLDETEVTAHMGGCHAVFGEWRHAMLRLQQAAEVPTARPTARFFYLTRLLQTVTDAGAWGDARTVVERLLPYIGEIGSGRTAGLLHDVTRRIEASPADPALRDAGRHLREVLIAAGYTTGRRDA
jgi:hypothetical protein